MFPKSVGDQKEGARKPGSVTQTFAFNFNEEALPMYFSEGGAHLLPSFF